MHNNSSLPLSNLALQLIDLGMASLPGDGYASSALQRQNRQQSPRSCGSSAGGGDSQGLGEEQEEADAEQAVVAEIMGSEPFVAPEVLRWQQYSPAVE